MLGCWANETYQMAQLEVDKPSLAQLRTFFREAHFNRLNLEQPVQVLWHRLPAAEAISAKFLDQLLEGKTKTWVCLTREESTYC